jgi:hypothetical protein
MSRTSIACAIVALCCMSPFARAVATVYTTIGTFNAAAPGTTLETFDAGGVFLSSPFVNGAITTSDPNGGDGVVRQTAQYGSGLSAQLTTNGPAPTIQFAVSGPVTAFGFDLFDLGTFGATTLTFTLSNGDVGTFAGPGFTSSSGNQLFFGVTSTSAFNSIQITNTQSGDFLEFDNARYGNAAGVNAVPLPAAAWCGFALIGGIGARRAARKAKNELSIA